MDVSMIDNVKFWSFRLLKGNVIALNDTEYGFSPNGNNFADFVEMPPPPNDRPGWTILQTSLEAWVRHPAGSDTYIPATDGTANFFLYDKNGVLTPTNESFPTDETDIDIDSNFNQLVVSTRSPNNQVVRNIAKFAVRDLGMTFPASSAAGDLFMVIGVLYQ